MTTVSSLSWPASAKRPNEDALALGDGIGVVIDGAGIPAELRAGCRHTVAWYAKLLAVAFRDRLAERTDGMAPALARAIVDVRAEHEDECDLDRGSPSATVAAWRISPDGAQVGHLVLCDASVVLAFRDGRVVELTDTRLDETVSRIAHAFRGVQAPAGSGVLTPRRLAVEACRNTPGGFWCAQHDPAVADHALTGVARTEELRAVIAASDGATRGHQGLRALAVEAFAAHALDGPDGLHALADIIREGEKAREQRHPGAYGKPHDDLTIAVCAF